MPNTSVEHQLDEMKTDMKEIRDSVSQIAVALTKLAVLEEKSYTFASALERVVNKVERMEERQREDIAMRDTVLRNALRLDAVETKASTTHIEQIKFNAEVGGISKTIKFMWTAFGAGVLYIGSQIVTFIMNMPKPKL